MRRDLSGKKFGSLLALEFIGQDKHHHSLWRCLCDCGKELDVTTTNLSSRKQTSCGCQHIIVTKENMRFGKLVTLYKVRNTTWLCKCDCGKEIKVTSGVLLRGERQSCGCWKGHAWRDRGDDLTGKIVGSLTVKSKAGKDKHNHNLWNAICVCGKEIILTASQLGEKGSKSCGCKKISNRKNHANWNGHEEISGYVWGRIYKGAFNRRLEFSITIENAWDLFIKQDRKCALTGLDIVFAKTQSRITEATASLDRIDSSKGYTLDNIQWVHKKINVMKMQHSQTDFIHFCNLVTKHTEGKNSDKQ